MYSLTESPIIASIYSGSTDPRNWFRNPDYYKDTQGYTRVAQVRESELDLALEAHMSTPTYEFMVEILHPRIFVTYKRFANEGEFEERVLPTSFDFSDKVRQTFGRRGNHVFIDFLSNQPNDDEDDKTDLVSFWYNDNDAE